MATVTLPDGTVLTRIPRQQVLARVNAITLGTILYSQSTVSKVTGKRSDCTGWVSYCWKTPDAGPGIYLKAYNTASFYTQKVIIPIDWADLLPGDAIGYFAPSSPGNGGHAAIWMGGDKRPDGTFDVCDHGSGWGPKRRRVKWDGKSTGWLHPTHLAPWRYVGIVEADGTTYQPGQSNLEDEMETSKWQTILQAMGFDPGPIDNQFGPRTAKASNDFAAFIAELRKAGAPNVDALAEKVAAKLGTPAKLTKAAILAALAE